MLESYRKLSREPEEVPVGQNLKPLLNLATFSQNWHISIFLFTMQAKFCSSDLTRLLLDTEEVNGGESTCCEGLIASSGWGPKVSFNTSSQSPRPLYLQQMWKWGHFPGYLRVGKNATLILYGRSGLVVNNTEQFSRPVKQFLLCYRNKNIYLKLLKKLQPPLKTCVKLFLNSQQKKKWTAQ